MRNLPILDLSIIVTYLVIMVLVGIYFSRKNKSSNQFTKASGKIPGWAIGLSLYATFLSSNTFLGVPGKAFGTNWNAFVFSISMPFAAWIASKYFEAIHAANGIDILKTKAFQLVPKAFPGTPKKVLLLKKVA